MAVGTPLSPTFSLLPPVMMGLPLLGGIVLAWMGERRARLRNLSAVAFSGATLAAAIALAAQVFNQGVVYFNLDLLKIGDRFVLNLEVDALGAFFALFASILWFAACMHAYRYMDHEHKRTRFFLFTLITETATLGVFLVRDFFSLFVFFELMGLAAFLLVIHSETDKARQAAIKYMYMTVVGGLSLLAGIWLYYQHSGTLGFIPPQDSSWLAGSLKLVALGCLIAGFGVKAGMVPLHIWLPDAHPAAPSPASALLSGVMIKAGAYGIIRTVLTFFYHPLAHHAGEGAHVEVATHGGGAVAQSMGNAAHSSAAAHGGLAFNLQTLGLAIIWIAVVTMFVGMALALVQDDIKRTLAYSSVSQMGYILFGVGCLAFLGSEGAIGLGGSLYHIINHAYFKGCFFLAAGSILFCTHELNMFELGGLWRKMPITCFCWCVAALGIMGIALFNGFVSKTLLHHAIVEAHHLSGEARYTMASWIKAAEVLFIITSGGTIAYNLKMLYYIFFRKPEKNNEKVEHAKEAPLWMLAGTAILALGVLFNGIFPGIVIRKLILGVANLFPALEHHTVEHLGEISIYQWSNIKEIIIPILIGIAVFIFGARKDLFRLSKIRLDLFHIRLPRWLGVDYWYVQGAGGFIATLYIGKRVYGRIENKAVNALKSKSSEMLIFAQKRIISPIREYQGDLALGALVLAVSLVLFLLIKLL